ncbi:serine hydrolase [Thauera sinica]|uniref:Serine hydrolase n=1 Tax=Thauera sinica TaxID=2665146 RepID=A0ABW1AT41_9RHOO|nr:serine hydrolase [Thauera sp. K11]ATE58823.1 peptidase [Thauera sp. K11]
MKPRLLLAFLLGLSVVHSGLNAAAAAPSAGASKAGKATKAAGSQARAAAKPAPKSTAKTAGRTSAKAAVRVAKPSARAEARRAKARSVAEARGRTAAKGAPLRVSLRKQPVLGKTAPAAALIAPAAAEPELTLDAHGLPQLGSAAFYVANQTNGEVLLERNASSVLPIASITKLMTAMVVLDSGQGLSEELVISEGDIDTLKGTGSRLVLGTRLTREQMLNLALMSSENRAASALARHYPGGEQAFVVAMNIKARMLGLADTRFHDSTGLTPLNVSSPRDLAKMVAAAAAYPLIREFSTTPERYVEIGARQLRFSNTNSLVKSPDWQIAVQKTGYISEAGRCLVMQAWIHQQPVVMVLMDSNGRYTRTADAQRVRKWLETEGAQRLAAAHKGRAG